MTRRWLLLQWVGRVWEVTPVGYHTIAQAEEVRRTRAAHFGAMGTMGYDVEYGRYTVIPVEWPGDDAY